MSPKLRILIPLLIVTGFLLYTWTLIVLHFNFPSLWKGTSLILFISLFHFYFTRYSWCVVLTGIYLVLLTFNVLTITPDYSAFFIQFGQGGNSVVMPGVQLTGLGILIIYGILNFDPLTKIYLDYKEAKAKIEAEK